MWGVNLYTGGHFDLYVADYFDYKVSRCSPQLAASLLVLLVNFLAVHPCIVTGWHADLAMTVLLGDEQAGEIDDQEFDVPSFCPEKPDPDEPGSNGGRFHRNMGGLARMRSLLPNAHYGVLAFFLSSNQASPHSMPSFGLSLL